MNKTQSDNNLTESSVYRIEKMTFIVEPVFKDNSDRSVFSILIALMKKDAEYT